MGSKQRKLGVIRYDHQVWDHPENWPHDPLDYVFLARAFQGIGRARYGDQWSNSYVEPPGEPPEDCDDSADEQYELVCEEAEAKFESMRASIAHTIAEQSRLGMLMTALRPIAGGQMNTLEPYFWNTENFAPRFFRCQMSLSRPFGDPARVRFEPLYWIFVTRESLDGKIGRASATGLTPNSAETGQSKRKDHPRRRREPTWGVADMPLVKEMHRRIVSGLARSPHDAARQLAPKAQGGGSEESKKTRLAKRYEVTDFTCDE
jgi:hypothetical protein